MMAVTNRVGMRATALSLTIFVLAVGAAMGLCGRGSGTRRRQTAIRAAQTVSGTWVSEGEGIDAKYTFRRRKAQSDGQRQRLHLQGQDRHRGQTVRHVDFMIEDGPDDAKGKTSKCIYKLDGEKFTLCVSVPGKDRPKDFAQVEDESYLFELKKKRSNSAS